MSDSMQPDGNILHKPARIAPGAENYNVLVVYEPAWIEIELVDEADNPVPDELYRIILPDGTCQEGMLDTKGGARIEGFRPGMCRVVFPNLDPGAWEDIDADAS